MNNKIDLKAALIALDMVHADLFIRLETMAKNNTKLCCMNEIEIRSLYLLVSNAMIDIGDNRLTRKQEL